MKWQLSSGLAAAVGLALAACAGPSAGDGTTSGGSTGGSSTTGSVGYTTGGPPPSDGGCTPDLKGTELARCTRDADCDCPERCVLDPGVATTVCEIPCTATSDCSSAVTSCVGGSCAIHFCVATQAGASAPGAFGASCGASAPDAGDGTCIPAFNGGASLASFGYCVPNGTASSACNAGTPDNPAGPVQDLMGSGSTRTPASDYCGAGKACTTTSSGSGTCEAFCQPASGDCTGGNTCVAQDSSTSWGLCGACIAAGQACLLNSDCCTESCDPVMGCAGSCDNIDGC